MHVAFVFSPSRFLLMKLFLYFGLADGEARWRPASQGPCANIGGEPTEKRYYNVIELPLIQIVIVVRGCSLKKPSVRTFICGAAAAGNSR